MSGRYAGVQARIKEQYSMAIYVHCLDHILNLAVNDSATDPHIRNAIAIIQKTFNFFTQSSKFSNLLAPQRDLLPPETSAQKLRDYVPLGGWSVVLYH
jgi:hypothetical protein